MAHQLTALLHANITCHSSAQNLGWRPSNSLHVLRHLIVPARPRFHRSASSPRCTPCRRFRACCYHSASTAPPCTSLCSPAARKPHLGGQPTTKHDLVSNIFTAHGHPALVGCPDSRTMCARNLNSSLCTHRHCARGRSPSWTECRPLFSSAFCSLVTLCPFCGVSATNTSPHSTCVLLLPLTVFHGSSNSTDQPVNLTRRVFTLDDLNVLLQPQVCESRVPRFDQTSSRPNRCGCVESVQTRGLGLHSEMTTAFPLASLASHKASGLLFFFVQRFCILCVSDLLRRPHH